MGARRSTRREPTQSQGKHANSAQMSLLSFWGVFLGRNIAGSSFKSCFSWQKKQLKQSDSLCAAALLLGTLLNKVQASIDLLKKKNDSVGRWPRNAIVCEGWPNSNTRITEYYGKPSASNSRAGKRSARNCIQSAFLYYVNNGNQTTFFRNISPTWSTWTL